MVVWIKARSEPVGGRIRIKEWGLKKGPFYPSEEIG
jgi:hypothetical protein